ncbi:hypothetical protein JCM14036_26940 [Desulfotomaculum defluvii]
MFPKYTRVILCNGKEYYLTEAWSGEIVVKQEGSDTPLDWQSFEYIKVVSEYKLGGNNLSESYQY